VDRSTPAVFPSIFNSLVNGYVLWLTSRGCFKHLPVGHCLSTYKCSISTCSQIFTLSTILASLFSPCLPRSSIIQMPLLKSRFLTSPLTPCELEHTSKSVRKMCDGSICSTCKSPKKLCWYEAAGHVKAGKRWRSLCSPLSSDRIGSKIC